MSAVFRSSIPFEQRVETLNAYLDTAQQIANEHGITDVTWVLDTLVASSVPVEPISFANGAYGYTGYLPSIGMYVMSQKDAELSPEFAKRYTKKATNFLESENIITLQENLPAVLGALILVHEGLHAIAHKERWWPDEQRPWHHIVNEHQAYKIEHQLMTATGGEAYAATLERQKETFAEGLKEKKMRPYADKENVATVADIFGISPHDRNIGFLAGAFSMHAFYSLQDGGSLTPKNITDECHYTNFQYQRMSYPPKAPVVLGY